MIPRQKNIEKAMCHKRIIYDIFFKSTGLLKTIMFEGQKTVSANQYTAKCLPENFTRNEC